MTAPTIRETARRRAGLGNDREPESGGAGRRHRVSRGDAESSIAERILSGALASETAGRLGAALREWLEQQGWLALGRPLSDLEGIEIDLPPREEFAAFLRELDRTGRLPDGRSGEASARLRKAAAAATDAGAPPPPELVAPPRIRRAEHPKLAPLPRRRRPGVDAEVVRLARQAAVPQAAFAALADFCGARGVDMRALLPLLEAGRYAGGEMAAALATYAVVLEARVHELLDDEQLLGLSVHLLPALERGDLRFAVGDLAGSYAEYDAERNTLSLAPPGARLGDALGRALLLHEAQHAVQDARRDTASRYQAEREAHAVEAEYLLRSCGALREIDGRVVVDLAQAETMLAAGRGEGGGYATHEIHAIEARLLAALEEIRDLAEPERLVQEVDLDQVIAERRAGAGERFEAAYLRVALAERRYAGLGADAVDALLRKPRSKNGL